MRPSELARAGGPRSRRHGTARLYVRPRAAWAESGLAPAVEQFGERVSSSHPTRCQMPSRPAVLQPGPRMLRCNTRTRSPKALHDGVDRRAVARALSFGFRGPESMGSRIRSTRSANIRAFLLNWASRARWAPVSWAGFPFGMSGPSALARSVGAVRYFAIKTNFATSTACAIAIAILALWTSRAQFADRGIVNAR